MQPKVGLLVHCFLGTGFDTTAQACIIESFLPQLSERKESCIGCGFRSEEGVESPASPIPLGAEALGLCEPPKGGFVGGGIQTPSLLKG